MQGLGYLLDSQAGAGGRGFFGVLGHRDGVSFVFPGRGPVFLWAPGNVQGVGDSCGSWPAAAGWGFLWASEQGQGFLWGFQAGCWGFFLLPGRRLVFL